GTVAAAIQLAPLRGAAPRVQSLTLAIPPAEGSSLAAAVAAVIAWMNGGDGGWPSAVPVSAGVDEGMTGRRLRMAATWAGTCAAGVYLAGDGSSAVTIELAGEHATVTLSLLVNRATGELRQADVSL
ncbi:MAG: hypothetical protein ACRDOI_19585, partial [Trebonia sp.]